LVIKEINKRRNQMDINNIANSPIEFTLSKKVYRVKRLSLLDLFSSFEGDVKREYMENIAAYAKTIEDAKEKNKFQTMAMKEMPRGKELEEMVSSKMNGVDGAIKIMTLALSKCQQITSEEVKNIIQDPVNTEVITVLMDFIIGNDQKVNEPEKKVVVPTPMIA
jgi:hypothetical protein